MQFTEKKLVQQDVDAWCKEWAKFLSGPGSKLLPYLILAQPFINYPMVIFVQPRPGDPVKTYQPTVDLGISWYEDELTTKISHSFYWLCQYVHCVAKWTYTFKTCHRLGKKQSHPSWMTCVFRLLFVTALKINALFFPRSNNGMISLISLKVVMPLSKC